MHAPSPPPARKRAWPARMEAVYARFTDGPPRPRKSKPLTKGLLASNKRAVYARFTPVLHLITPCALTEGRLASNKRSVQAMNNFQPTALPAHTTATTTAAATTTPLCQCASASTLELAFYLTSI